MGKAQGSGYSQEYPEPFFSKRQLPSRVTAFVTKNQ